MANIMGLFDTHAQAAAGATLHFVHPKTGEKVFNISEKEGEEPVSIPVTVTMIGKASLEYLGTLGVEELRTLRQKAGNKNKDNDALEHESGIEQTYFEDTFKEQARKLSKVIKSWTGFEDENGPIEFSQEAVEKAFLKHGALRLQGINFLDNEKNFIQG